MKDAEFDHVEDAASRSGSMSFADGLVLAKLSAMAVLGISSFVLGILPMRFAACMKKKSGGLPQSSGPPGHHQHHQPLVISLLLCFGGGVLLYTTFMHLQPEVREGMEHVIATGIIPQPILDTGINIAELVFCIGFFFVYFIEELVHCCLDTTSHEEDEVVLHRSLSVRRCRSGNMIPRINLNKSPNHSPPSTITASTQILIRDYQKPGQEPIMAEPSETASATSAEPVSVVKSFRGLLAIIALSFHAVFEGLAVGLEKKSSNVWYLCAAIATHKLVIAFCLGVELVSSRTKSCLILTYMATFAAVSPLGIGLGLVLSEGGTTPQLELASVLLQGMAAGTLLYVVFFEVLQREKAHTKNGILQLFSIIFGFAVMIALGLLIGHHEHSHFGGGDHDHHHDHDHDHDHDHVH